MSKIIVFGHERISATEALNLSCQIYCTRGKNKQLEASGVDNAVVNVHATS